MKFGVLEGFYHNKRRNPAHTKPKYSYCPLEVIMHFVTNSIWN